jgi:enoyl-CoA hydratase/carnithine racemase
MRKDETDFVKNVTKEGDQMNNDQNIFNYNTFDVFLNRNYKSLEVFFKSELINTETIFELESLYSWLSSHIEINAVVLSSKNDSFLNGIDCNEMARLADQKWQRNLVKLQHLIYNMFFLPQTFIVDLKNGAKGVGAELALGADLRVAHNNVEVQFTHLQKGLVPHCGAVGFLTPLFGASWSRQWLMSGKAILAEELRNSGFVHNTYESESTVDNLLKEICSQSPVARIQTKRSLLESIMSELDRTLSFEKKFALAGMSTGDWKKIAQDDNSELMNARDYAKKLKEEKKQQELNH